MILRIRDKVQNIDACFSISTYGLLPGQHHWSEVYVCPYCGESWGTRQFVDSPSNRYVATMRECLFCGDGCLLKPDDFLHADLPETLLRYFTDEYFRNSDLQRFADFN
jgi:hypothetical protein